MPGSSRLIVLMLASAVAWIACGCGARRPPAPEVVLMPLMDERGVANPVITAAARDVDAGRPREGFARLADWFRDPASATDPERPDALYVAANALLDFGRINKAFYYLDELLDTYPDSALYRPAARRQYEIGEAVLRDRPGTFLRFGPGEFDALEMLFRVQRRAPGSELAETSLLRTADHYFDRGDYDFASDAYTVYVESFQRSPGAPRARIRQAWSNLLQYKGPRYDPTPLINARTQFDEILATQDVAADEAAAIGEAMTFIDEQLARKSVLEARYLRRVRRPSSAEVVLAEAADTLPETQGGREAIRRLGREDAGGEVP